MRQRRYKYIIADIKETKLARDKLIDSKYWITRIIALEKIRFIRSI